MNLDTFLYNLHFDIDKASPPNWQVDWNEAPLAYKLYRGLPVFPFSLEIPLTFEGLDAPIKPDLRSIGNFLWYVFGLAQVSQSPMTSDLEGKEADIMQSYRRFVPSGGALYPNELYIYLKIEDLPKGVYHYDVAHHQLVLLREGNFDSYIAQSLGKGYAMDPCFGAVFVSTMFWKNFFKYNNFSYRLQGLDAGVLIGQLLEVAKRFGFETGVYFQFLDRALNHLLGLSEQEESVYAIIQLSAESTDWSTNWSDLDGAVFATELSQELTPIKNSHTLQSRTGTAYPMLTKLNEVSMLESTRSFRRIHATGKINIEGDSFILPQVKPLSYDLASVCQKRYSPDMDFVMGKINQFQLATLLQEAIASYSYQNDLDAVFMKNEPRVSLLGCLYHVEGVPDGAYYYDSTAHKLQQVNVGDQRLQLQYGMSGNNVNLFQVPFCLHVAGDKNHYITELGYRGYRIQQMEAGMLVQRLLLTASAIGIGGHPLLGFDANLCDEIYKIGAIGKTSLIQIPIGPFRPRPWLRGNLLS